MIAVPVSSAPDVAPHVLTASDSTPVLETLVHDMARGDQRALKSFYQHSIRRIFGLAWRITQRRELAEEVAADVYVQIWNQAGQYERSRGAALAWALTICRSRAIDALRRRDIAICDADPTTRIDVETVDSPSLQDLLQATQEHAALHRALTRLSAVQRQLLGLAYFRGQSHQEMADHLGLPLGTVKSHVRRALAALRHEMEAG